MPIIRLFPEKPKPDFSSIGNYVSNLERATQLLYTVYATQQKALQDSHPQLLSDIKETLTVLKRI